MRKSPTPFTPERQARFLKVYEETGTFHLSARAAGVVHLTVRRFMEKNEEYAEEVADALKRHTERCEQEAYRRAVEGIREPVLYQGEQVYVNHETLKDPEDPTKPLLVPLFRYTYSDRMLEMRLKAFDAKYRDRQTVDLNVTPGALVVPGLSKTGKDWEDEYGSTPADGEESGST